MYARVLVPIDGSACSDEAAAHGIAIAKAMGAAVVFLFVMDTLSARREGVVNMAEALRALTTDGRSIVGRAERSATDAGVRAAGRLIEGSPADVIVRVSAEFDLVVMGSHGKGLLRRLTAGSVTEDVLHRITRPLLIVRAPDESRTFAVGSIFEAI